MGIEQPREYYEELFQSSPEYGKPADEATWFPVWRALSTLLPDTAEIVDLGCGPGQSATVLALGRPYIGVDFSPTALARARHLHPSLTFLEFDLNNPLPAALLDKRLTYVISETLEHIDGDLALLGQLPTGATIAGSVPTFDTESHVRHFTSIQEVTDRYSHLLDFLTVTRVGVWFVFVALRNEKALDTPTSTA